MIFNAQKELISKLNDLVLKNLDKVLILYFNLDKCIKIA